MRLSFKALKEELSWEREKIRPKPRLFHMISIRSLQHDYSTLFMVLLISYVNNYVTDNYSNQQKHIKRLKILHDT
jgi:type III secretory pathway component EscU